MAKKIDDATFFDAAERHGHNAYAMAKELGIDHSSTAQRLRRHFPKQSFAGIPCATINKDLKRFVMTCAVSGAEVQPTFLASLESFCSAMAAQLVVVPIRYRNPTSNKESPADWFDPSILKYIYHRRTLLHKNLQLMADVPVAPTAARPLSGMAIMGHGRSVIFAHPKVAFESVPVSPGDHPKIAVTTGAVTVADYSHSKAGRKGEFHHVLGALLVESDGNLFHVRHLLYDDDGGFSDITGRWEASGRVGDAGVDVITFGDLHGCRHDKALLAVNLSMIGTLRPKHVVLHDVFDCQAVSHHNKFFDLVRLHATGEDDVSEELKKTADVLNKYAKGEHQTYVVESNHHNHLTQWLLNPLNAHDVINTVTYHGLKSVYLRMLTEGQDLNILQYALVKAGHAGAVFLGDNEPMTVQDVEHGYHGHKGPGGARGNAVKFAGVGIKSTIGHSHSPGIVDGCYQVGTSSQLDMGYNRGAPSAWMHTHCVQYSNGKRTLINVIGGRWRKVV